MKGFLKSLNNFLLIFYLILWTISLFKTVYPENFERFKINIVYNLIYYYSKIQITVKNIKNYLTENVNNILYYIYANDNNDYLIEVVFEGNIIDKISKNNIDNLLNINFDFILYSEIIDNLIHKRIIYSENLDINNEKLFVCEPSEIKFVLSEISLGNKTISVDFKINNNNYYVCDNIFTNKFIIYFLNEYYSEHITDVSPNEIMNYKIEILDHNVNKETFDFKNDIKINKTSYCILNK